MNLGGLLNDVAYQQFPSLFYRKKEITLNDHSRASGSFES